MNRNERIVESDPLAGFGGDAEENAKRSQAKDEAKPAERKDVAGPAERKNVKRH